MRVEGDGTLRYDTKDYAEFHRIDPNKLRLHQRASVEFIYVITRRVFASVRTTVSSKAAIPFTLTRVLHTDIGLPLTEGRRQL